MACEYDEVDMPTLMTSALNQDPGQSLPCTGLRTSQLVPLAPIRPSASSSLDSGYHQCPVSSVEVEEDEVFNLEEAEMDDDVFDEEPEERSSVGEPVMDFVDRLIPFAVAGGASSLSPMRSRAFSFPFTLTDIRFSLTFPLSDSRLHRSSPFFPMNISSRFSSVASDEDEDSDDYQPEEIDDIMHDKPCSYLPRADVAAKVRLLRQNGALPLPDVILSGSCRRRSDTLNCRSAQDTPDSLYSHSRPTDMEYQIASRLAKIGDEFDLKFFSPKCPVDTPDSVGSIGQSGSGYGISLRSAARLWNYLSTSASKSTQLLCRQRSRSTTE